MQMLKERVGARREESHAGHALCPFGVCVAFYAVSFVRLDDGFWRHKMATQTLSSCTRRHLSRPPACLTTVGKRFSDPAFALRLKASSDALRLPGCDSTGFQNGLILFNAAQFFEAHEVLEDVWRAAPEPERKFLQGQIQIAVALHHHSTGNVIGCRSSLRRGLRNLTPYPDRHFCTLNSRLFRDAV